ncbi:hypothetical protein AB6D94_24035, partial [Vibrio sp. 10N.247.310.56]|uniref:hypothetical protein n=1 Tax=unclassified Vibrio TaxID=2614977 RepID=UPI00354C4DD4
FQIRVLGVRISPPLPSSKCIFMHEKRPLNEWPFCYLRFILSTFSSLLCDAFCFHNTPTFGEAIPLL